MASLPAMYWVETSYMNLVMPVKLIDNVYNMSDRAASNIQSRAEGE